MMRQMRNDAFYAVHRLASGFEVEAHQQFTHQPYSEHLHAEKAQHHSKNHKRAMHGEYGNMQENSIEEQCKEDCASSEDPEQARRPKEVERLRHVPHEESYGDDVEKDAQRP